MQFIRSHWRLTLALIAAALLVAGHRPILRGVALGLVVDDPIERCDALLVVSGDRDYAVAAELYVKKLAVQIVLLQERSRPLVQCGIIESSTETTRREIRKRGVPEEAIEVAPGEVFNIWDIADRVQERLAADPKEEIGILADLLQTERIDWILSHVLSASQKSRVRIHALRDRRFDETNWWRHRLGITNVVSTYLRYGYNVFGGRPEPFRSEIRNPNIEIRNKSE